MRTQSQTYVKPLNRKNCQDFYNEVQKKTNFACLPVSMFISFHGIWTVFTLIVLGNSIISWRLWLSISRFYLHTKAFLKILEKAIHFKVNDASLRVWSFKPSQDKISLYNSYFDWPKQSHWFRPVRLIFWLKLLLFKTMEFLLASLS